MPPSVLDSIALVPTCPQELTTISTSRKETFSPGVDELNPQAISAAIDPLVEPLAQRWRTYGTRAQCGTRYDFQWLAPYF